MANTGYHWDGIGGGDVADLYESEDDGHGEYCDDVDCFYACDARCDLEYSPVRASFVIVDGAVSEVRS